MSTSPSSRLIAGQPVATELSRKMAEAFLKNERQRIGRQAPASPDHLPGIETYSIHASHPIENDKGQVLAYVHSLTPEGYIITSGNTGIRPIIGFSFNGAFSFDSAKSNVRLHLLKAELEERIKLLAQMADAQNRRDINSNLMLWASLF